MEVGGADPEVLGEGTGNEWGVWEQGWKQEVVISPSQLCQNADSAQLGFWEKKPQRPSPVLTRAQTCWAAPGVEMRAPTPSGAGSW